MLTEKFHATWHRIDIDTSPTSLIQQSSIGKVERVVSTDVKIETFGNTKVVIEQLSQKYVFAFPRVISSTHWALGVTVMQFWVK